MPFVFKAEFTRENYIISLNALEPLLWCLGLLFVKSYFPKLFQSLSLIRKKLEWPGSNNLCSHRLIITNPLTPALVPLNSAEIYLGLRHSSYKHQNAKLFCDSDLDPILLEEFL